VWLLERSPMTSQGSKAAPEVSANRAGRQARIVAILSTAEVRSQSELAALLAAEGIEVTQATLSRDLEELGAVKLARAPTAGTGVYIVPEDGSPVRGVSGGTDRIVAPAQRVAGVDRRERQPRGVCARRPVRRTTWPAPSTARPCPRSSAPSPVMTHPCDCP